MGYVTYVFFNLSDAKQGKVKEGALPSIPLYFSMSENFVGTKFRAKNPPF